MRRTRHIIARRRPVFLGCEGESERAYSQVLGDIVWQKIDSVHLEVMLLGEGAGSPLAKIHKAIKKIEDYERKRSRFWKKAVLIDSDLIAQNDNQGTDVERLAADHNIRVIWQRPCHEAFLLRHLPNCAQRRPPASALANSALIAEWPGYQKPMTRSQIAKMIDGGRIRQATSVESELRSFLTDIEWQ